MEMDGETFQMPLFKGFMHIQKVLEKREEGHMTQCQDGSQFC